MGDFLNFVFDDWEDGKNEPNNNSEKSFGENFGYRTIDNIMDFFKYKSYKKYKIEDIYKYPDKKFYYLIWSVNSFNSHLSHNILPVNNNVVSYINKYENLNLILLNEQESEGILELKKLNELCDILKINTKQVWFVSNNSKLSDSEKIINTNLNVHTTKALSVLLKNVITNSKIKIELIKNKNNYSLFLCHNNRFKEHRFLLLVLLKKYNIIKDVDWSLIEKNGYNKYNSIHDTFNIDTKIFKKEIKYFTGIKNHNSKYENNSVYMVDDTIDWGRSIKKETYENSYVNITTETLYNDRIIHITEKSFKPFAYYQFPLFLASHHHVKYLRENYDFDFFDDVIDHSYDNVVDNNTRIFKLVEEIKRIQDNKDFFINFYEENQDRFLENHRKYMKIDNQYDIDFFDSLI